MSFTLWVLSAFTNDIEQTDNNNKNQVKNIQNQNNVCLSTLRKVDADIVSFIDSIFAV